jgi:hypothetical protein
MDTQLLPCWLKTARRKKRLAIKGRDKELLRLDKLLGELQLAKRNLPMVLLEQPYQKGWKRLFVLKPRVRESEKAEFFIGILDKINTVEYHYDETFKISKREKRRNRGKLPGEPQTLRNISNYYWQSNKLNLTDEERSYFNPVYRFNEYNSSWSYSYEFIMPWLFELAVKPHIITKVKLCDELLEQELGFIDDWIYKSNRRYRLSKLEGGGYNYWKRAYYDKRKYVNPLKNKPVYLAQGCD